MFFDAKTLGESGIEIGDLHAEEAALHGTVIEQIFDDIERHIDRNSEADAGVHAGA